MRGNKCGDLKKHRRKLMAAFWLTAAALISLAIFIRPIVRFGEQSIYRDRVIFQTQTPYQRIVITEWKGYYWLYLNNNVQFTGTESISNRVLATIT